MLQDLRIGRNTLVDHFRRQLAVQTGQDLRPMFDQSYLMMLSHEQRGQMGCQALAAIKMNISAFLLFRQPALQCLATCRWRAEIDHIARF